MYRIDPSVWALGKVSYLDGSHLKKAIGVFASMNLFVMLRVVLNTKILFLIFKLAASHFLHTHTLVSQINGHILYNLKILST